jgi:glycosyltransferase involved in cell wall biosynthesis
MSDKQTARVKSVCIILCTYNGSKYLEQQIDSILRQDYPNISLVIFDDQSSDDTIDISKRFVDLSKGRSVKLVVNSQRFGSPHNFLQGLLSVGEDYDYYAFSDQDDVWLPSKISRAVEALGNPSEASLYYSNVTSVDSLNEKVLGESSIRPEFHNKKTALLANPAPGNTMVFTEALCKKVVQFEAPAQLPFHDWWIYLIALYSGADLRFDSHSYVRYRQHAHNRTGDGRRTLDRLRRFYELFKGERKGIIGLHARALLSSGLNFIEDRDISSLQLIATAIESNWHSRICLWGRYLDKPRKDTGVVLIAGLLLNLL